MIRNLEPHSKTIFQRINLPRTLSRNLSVSIALAASLNGCPPKYTTPIPTSSPSNILSPTPKTTPSPKPTPMWPEATNFKWEEISIPSTESVRDIKYYGNSLFALTINSFHKSMDNGQSWQNIPIDLPEIRMHFSEKLEKIDVAKNGLYNFDIDQNKIWLTCRNGIVVSDNLDGNFLWSDHWDYDGASDITMKNGFGWAAIPGCGSRSGLWKKTPDKDFWQSVASDLTLCGGEEIIVDPIDPANIVYTSLTAKRYAYTLDGGVNWTTWDSKHGIPIYASVWNDKSIIFNENEYSQDHGQTWNPLGISAQVIRKSGDMFYILGTDPSGYHGGLMTGTPNNWANHGWINSDFNIIDRSIFAATDSTIFATTYGHKLYRGTWQK